VTTILLTRHGETDWNRDARFQGHADPLLNEVGREQARRLAQTLNGEPLDALYASDLRRASQTAAIVGAELGLEVALDAGLREIDVGSWQGLTREEIGDRPWDGETYDHHRERVLEALRQIEERHPGGRVLVVSHGGSLRRVQEALLGEAMPVIDHCGVWPVVVESGDLRPAPS
jgi:broad specificity phosphatase PhoE